MENVDWTQADSVTRSSRCRNQGKVPGSPDGEALRVSGSRAVPGTGTLPLGDFHLAFLSLSLSAAVSGPPIGCSVSSCQQSSPRFRVTKSLGSRWTLFFPDPRDAGRAAENPPSAAAGCADPH